MDEKEAKKQISDIIFNALIQNGPISAKQDKEITNQIFDILNKIE